MKAVAITYAVVFGLAIALAILLHSLFSSPQTRDDASAGAISASASTEADVARIERQLVPRLYARSKRLRIGVPDCSQPTDSDVYYRICYLPVDGTRVPVGLRYDDGTERIIPHVLWSVINLKDLATSASVTAKFEYGTPGTATCGNSGVAILPSGARLTCTLHGGGRDYIMWYLVIHSSDPFPVLESIAGLHVNATVDTLRTLDARQIRSRSAIPGSLVRELYESVERAALNALNPTGHFGKIWCGRTIDLESPNNFCTVDSHYGYQRVGVALDPEMRIRLYWLSVAASRKRLESAGRRFAARALGGGRISEPVAVDCGPEDYVTLSLPSVHYCSIRSANGRAMRLGVEYYDRIEGIHFVVEKQPA